MTNAYELRNHFFLEDYNTAITREDFESFFTKTKEKVTFTFGGWDGKSGGSNVPDGAYYLVIKAKGADGRNYDIKKTINLLRGYTEAAGKN